MNSLTESMRSLLRYIEIVIMLPELTCKRVS
jgi:hypothetical protein